MASLAYGFGHTARGRVGVGVRTWWRQLRPGRCRCSTGSPPGGDRDVPATVLRRAQRQVDPSTGGLRPVHERLDSGVVDHQVCAEGPGLALVLPGGPIGAEHDRATAGPVQLGMRDRIALAGHHQGLDEAEHVAQEADLGAGVVGPEGGEAADEPTPSAWPCPGRPASAAEPCETGQRSASRAASRSLCAGDVVRRSLCAGDVVRRRKRTACPAVQGVSYGSMGWGSGETWRGVDNVPQGGACGTSSTPR